MTSRDPFSERAELEEALRRHYRAEVDRTDFAPISATEILRASRADAAPRRSRWLLPVAASAALVLTGSAIIGQLGSRPISAVPAPTPASTVPTAGTPGTGVAPAWTPRLTAPVDVARHAQTVVDDAVYLLAGVADDQTCELDGYRYLAGPDLWQRLAPGPERTAPDCAATAAFALGSRIYLTVDAGPGAVAQSRVELYSYDTEDDSWDRLPGPDLPAGETCTPVGLSTGIFCLDQAADAASAAPVTFHWFDPATRQWTPGEVQIADGQQRLSVTPEVVRLAGEEQVLLDARLPGGRIALATYDPVTRRLDGQTSHAGTGADLGPAQVTATGAVYFNPPEDPPSQDIAAGDPRATTALVADLGSLTWWTVEVPHLDGPLTATSPSEVAWAMRFYAASAAGYVNANGYLYEPNQRHWLAIAPLPEPEAGVAVPYAWVGGSLRCRSVEPLNCWGVAAGPLLQVATPIDPAAITASNAQVR